MKTNKEILSLYLPSKAIPPSIQLLESSSVQLWITRSRSSKLGDYRPPLNKKFHRISVNHDLNKYHFLITFIHEFAHLKNWELHQRNVKPHGEEWKTQFRELMKPFLNQEIFPDELLEVVNHFLKNPTSSVVNTKLLKKLREYDKVKNIITLEDIPINSTFRIYNGIIFRKLEKMRKRYKCMRLDTQRIYLVSPVMQVVPLFEN
jgi:SprT protein